MANTQPYKRRDVKPCLGCPLDECPGQELISEGDKIRSEQNIKFIPLLYIITLKWAEYLKLKK